MEVKYFMNAYINVFWGSIHLHLTSYWFNTFPSMYASLWPGKIHLFPTDQIYPMASTSRSIMVMPQRRKAPAHQQSYCFILTYWCAWSSYWEHIANVWVGVANFLWAHKSVIWCLCPVLHSNERISSLSWQHNHHDDVIKWKHFPRYWPFVRGIHRSPVNSPHKGQWRGALMFSLICT